MSDQQRPTPSDKRHHGFGSPEGMEMKDFSTAATAAAAAPPPPKPAPAAVPAREPTRQNEQQRKQPYPVPVSITSASSQSPPPMDMLPSTSTSTIDSTPPSMSATMSPLPAEETTDLSTSLNIPAKADETPTKPRKRRLFFTPSRRETTKSPQHPSRRQQQVTALSPLAQLSQQRQGSPAAANSPYVSSRTQVQSQSPYQTPGRTSATKTPSRRPGSGVTGRDSAGRRQRRTPVSRSGLSGLSSTTPRSANRRTPSRKKFNPLGKISDIFSPQSPVFSSSSSREGGTSSFGDSFGAPGGVDNRSLVSIESSDAGSVSTTNSVKEPFAEQVERLDQLLATPSKQLGELAFTPNKEYNSDDDLDYEMEDLETSRRLLAEELSRVEFSLLGGGNAEDDDSSDNDWIDNTTTTPKKQQRAAASKKDGQSDDWKPLLTSEDRQPPNFSPIGELKKEEASTAKSPSSKNADRSSQISSGSSAHRSVSISQDVTIYSGDEYFSPNMSSVGVRTNSSEEYFSPDSNSNDDHTGKSAVGKGESVSDEKPAARDAVKSKARRTKTIKDGTYESLDTPPRKKEKGVVTPKIMEKKSVKKESIREERKYSPIHATSAEEYNTTTETSATAQSGHSQETKGDKIKKDISFLPTPDEAKDSAPKRSMPNLEIFSLVDKQEDAHKKDQGAMPTIELPTDDAKEIQYVMNDPDDSSTEKVEQTRRGIDDHTTKPTTTLKPRPGQFDIQEKKTLPEQSLTNSAGDTREKEEDRRDRTSLSSMTTKEAHPQQLTPKTKLNEEYSKEAQSEKSSPDSNSTFDPFGFGTRGESQLSSVDIGSGYSSIESPASSSTASRNTNETIFQSFLSFAERFDDGGTSIGRSKSTSTPKRDMEHSRRILEHLNSIFTSSLKGDPNLPAVTPERSALLFTSSTDSPDVAKVSPPEKKVDGTEEELFSTPPRDQEPTNESICGLSPISQYSEQAHLSTAGRDGEDRNSFLESSPGNSIDQEQVPLSTTRARVHVRVHARKSKYEKPPKLNSPSNIVPILPDDGDDDIFYDPETPQAAESCDVLMPLPGDNDYVKFDTSKMPASYKSKDHRGPTPVKGITRKRCKKFFFFIAVLVFLIGVALVMGTIFYPSGETTFAPSRSSTSRPIGIDQTRTPTTMPAMSPSTIHIKPSLRPTNPFMPVNLNPPKPETVNPSLSPSDEGSESPTPINLIVFTISYNVYITNGRVNMVPQTEYVPELITSMDLLTDDILLNIVKRRSFEGRRRLTEVILPTTITDVVDVICPPDANVNNLCQEVTAKISLMDAEKTWQQFKATTELAIEIGRLQYYLDRVDPTSPVEVIDAVWSPSTQSHFPVVPEPIYETSTYNPGDSSSSTFGPPSSLPTGVPSPMVVSTPLLKLLKNHSFDGGEALNDVSSPQHRAYTWLQRNFFLTEYSWKRILQRYTMATLYYAANGDQWVLDDMWLSDRSECTWFSKTGFQSQCNREGEIVHLDLGLNNVAGSLPAELGLLSSGLETISIQGGPIGYIQGTLPSELGYLTQLKTLVLRNNDFSGTIPSELGNCLNLREFDLSRNGFRGELSSEIGNFAELISFDVSINFLSGSLPTELGQLRKSHKIFFEYNNFVSSIPTQIGHLKELQAIRGGGNELYSLPSELGELKFADIISFRDSGINGTIPTELGRLRKLRHLELYNNTLTGTIPSELANIVSLQNQLDLSHNKLSGSVPSELGMLVDLRGLKLHHNSLSGAVPSELSKLSKLTSIQINANHLSGTIPADVCKTFHVTFPAFQADCGDFEDDCPCCTICCVGENCACRHLGTSSKYLCMQRRKGNS